MNKHKFVLAKHATIIYTKEFTAGENYQSKTDPELIVT